MGLNEEIETGGPKQQNEDSNHNICSSSWTEHGELLVTINIRRLQLILISYRRKSQEKIVSRFVRNWSPFGCECVVCA